MPRNSLQLNWCLRQKRGIRAAKPSDNLLKAYSQKSETALKSMEVNAKAEIVEWTVSAAYYARYFAVYALLQRIGVKCEIHDCTIALFEYLFKDSISHKLIEELKDSKENRIEAQYYSTHVDVDLKEVMDKTRTFVMEIEKLIDDLNPGQIAVLQKKLRTALQSRKS